MQRIRRRRLKIKAFTITETLVAILISGIVLLCVYEGIGMVKRYADRLGSGMVDGSELLSGAERLENLSARTDSILKRGEHYLFYGVGDPVAVWRSDSLLIADHPARRDTLFITVQSIRERLSGPDQEKVDSLFITLELAAGSVCLAFVPVVREGRVMEKVREQELYVEKLYDLPFLDKSELTR